MNKINSQAVRSEVQTIIAKSQKESVNEISVNRLVAYFIGVLTVITTILVLTGLVTIY